MGDLKGTEPEFSMRVMVTGGMSDFGFGQFWLVYAIIRVGTRFHEKTSLAPTG